ncbi:hypothetical protein PMAL9190_03321 [Photobacterium malacitanum]|uniref:Uncharacterized protein n=1 Tax=Photobacterium malacitanum TaxID=2204294 RepID=A0A1Y6MN87_9GAMM|nr:hypothetical protein PMAL9190_03321 [Photobacterium malacitanum]
MLNRLTFTKKTKFLDNFVFQNKKHKNVIAMNINNGHEIITL